MVAFLLVNAPNCHISLELASVVQGNTVNCNTSREEVSLAVIPKIVSLTLTLVGTGRRSIVAPRWYITPGVIPQPCLLPFQHLLILVEQ